MNSLVHYSSDTESDLDESPTFVAATAAAPKPTSSSATSTPPFRSLAASPDQQHNTATQGPKRQDQHQTDHNGDVEMAAVAHESSADITAAAAAATGLDDGYVAAALKDLQSLAAAFDLPTVGVATTTSRDETRDAGDSTASMDVDSPGLEMEATDHTVPLSSEDILLAPVSIELTDEQQLLFDAFLREIDAIPLTTKDQTRPPLDQSSLSATVARSHGVEAIDQSSAASSESRWQQTQSPQSIYSRIYQLSLLSCPTIDHQDMEDRLIAFAIRILDWEQGGMKPSYFVGEARAQAMFKEDRGKNGDDSEDEDEDEDENDSGDGTMPPYGGVVGELLEHMYDVERSAAPAGWRLVWNASDNSYEFCHIATDANGDTGSDKFLSKVVQLVQQCD
ncbi:hypothetical protein BGZ99_010321 [Dissophora globulifera]|uniref:Uncharacterized protein n=1 Tax=Dissophora globulifera TaxID=979702 RepID=A0A9P6R4R5_9FUNG|nr:hypothetical protein BGZ99_010321 [Dissophora globulifera]